MRRTTLSQMVHDAERSVTSPVFGPGGDSRSLLVHDAVRKTRPSTSCSGSMEQCGAVDDVELADRDVIRIAVGRGGQPDDCPSASWIERSLPVYRIALTHGSDRATSWAFAEFALADYGVLDPSVIVPYLPAVDGARPGFFPYPTARQLDGR